MDDRQLLRFAQQVARVEADAVASVVAQIDEIMIQVARAVLKLKGRVIVTGSGTSSSIARRLAHLLSVSGTPALFLHAMDALHGSMGAVKPSDLLIVISKGGESDEVNAFAAAVKEQGTPVTAVTEVAGSTLGELANYRVVLQTPVGGDPGNMLAMGSTLVSSVWGDALTRTLMYLRGWDLSRSLEMHPAGAVGKIAKPVQGRRKDR